MLQHAPDYPQLRLPGCFLHPKHPAPVSISLAPLVHWTQVTGYISLKPLRPLPLPLEFSTVFPPYSAWTVFSLISNYLTGFDYHHTSKFQSLTLPPWLLTPTLPTVALPCAFSLSGLSGSASINHMGPSDIARVSDVSSPDSKLEGLILRFSLKLTHPGASSNTRNPLDLRLCVWNRDVSKGGGDYVTRPCRTLSKY